MNFILWQPLEAFVRKQRSIQSELVNFMKTIPMLVAMLLVILSPEYCPGQQDQNELINRLVKISGLSSQIEQIHTAVWAAAPADAFATESQGTEAFKRFKKAFTTDRLMSLIRDQMMSSFDEDKIESLIKFHETTLGRKLARIQKDVLNIRNLKITREGRKNAALLEGKRLGLISRLMELNKAAEINAQLATEFVMGMLDNNAAPDAHRLSEETIYNQAKTTVALEKNLVDETTILSYANNLKSFDENELTALVTFFETPEAEWFMETTGSFFRNAARELGKALTETLANRSG